MNLPFRSKKERPSHIDAKRIIGSSKKIFRANQSKTFICFGLFVVFGVAS